jgi:hypothetical protein
LYGHVLPLFIFGGDSVASSTASWKDIVPG